MKFFHHFFTKSKEYDGYYIKQKFNGSTYELFFYIRMDKVWVALSSGKKRKELDIYVDKERKSDGGMQALVWAKEYMLLFPSLYNKSFVQQLKYICISPTDSRRRRIYAKRLKTYGFQEGRMEGEMVIFKKIK